MVDPNSAPHPLSHEGIARRLRRMPSHGLQGPATLELYPTLLCNLSCRFCDTTLRHRKPEGELSRERLLALVDEAAELGVERVFVLGGGEPLLRRDATPDLLRRIKALGLEGILTTNGSFLDASLAEQLIETAFDEVHVSIDGPTAAIHDDLRGQPGAFRRTVRNTCRLAAWKRQRGLAFPRIALHFVLTRLNWRTLPDMVELAHSLGAFRIDFDALVAYAPEQKALELTVAERSAVPAVAAEALERARALGIQTTLEHFLHPHRLERGSQAPPTPEVAPGTPDPTGLKGAPCLKAWHYLVVQADGRSSPCCVLAGQGGDAGSQALSTLWASDPFLETVRSGMREGRPLPRCRECSWNILAHEAAIREHL